MRRLIFSTVMALTVASLTVTSLTAQTVQKVQSRRSAQKMQTARQELDADPNCSASCYLAYSEPTGVNYTPAPKDYKPCYLSHYGRHGSRYLLGDKDYDLPLIVLMHADSLGRLTPRGKKMLNDVKLLREESRNRIGELTPLGALQHQGIAQRIVHNFPEIFAGNAHVDANSTTVIRCILSMSNEMQELTRLNPQLSVSMDASQHDMWYMLAEDKPLQKLRRNKEARSLLDAFKDSKKANTNIYKKLFTDSAGLFTACTAHRFYDYLFQLGGEVQNTEYRNKMSFYDIYSKDEVYSNWIKSNANWYYDFAGFIPSGSQQYTQRHLLRKIIQQADSCLLLDTPGATMRFGHDVVVLPLVCLMNINGNGLRTSNLNDLIAKDWADYRIFPMGSNVQLIFYRRYKHDKDVLVKVLLNEREATLPLQTNQAPYYHWNDVRAYYLNLANL